MSYLPKSKRPGFYTFTETWFINNSRSKQNKKIPHSLVRRKHVQNFSKKKLNSTVVGACQSFKFFGQITWFLGNKRVLPRFKCWILHHLISIIKVQN